MSECQPTFLSANFGWLLDLDVVHIMDPCPSTEKECCKALHHTELVCEQIVVISFMSPLAVNRSV